MRNRNSSRYTRYVLGYIVALLVLVLATGGAAQVKIFPTPTPTPRRTPAPTPTVPPSASPTVEPLPSDEPTPSATDEPADTDKPKKPNASASPTPSPLPGDENFDKLPDELAKEDLVVPVIPRTRPRNTAHLVELLRPLTRYGLSLEQVLIEGMGRFPVAGVAYYRDDWLNPRYNPVPHLHHGLDIFADFGTPIRSPDKGVVTRFTNDPERGGIGVWTRGSDGTGYYFAHLLQRVDGLYVGKRVGIGTVLGFVGDSGNASGGAPHLHFEIHRPGAVPPKPSVDKWLDEAIDLAPRWVEARKQEIDSKREIIGGQTRTGSANPTGDLDTSMLLTLLDPVGGSVGLLPRLELAPVQRAPVSSALLTELIRLRLDGYLFAPSRIGIHQRD